MSSELDADELHQLRCDRNRFVAEHVMGWEFDKNPHGWRLWFPHGRGTGEALGDDHLPDFFNSRDACARAEAKIVEMQEGRTWRDVDLESAYVVALADIVEVDRLTDYEGCTEWESAMPLVTATARQRCEAMYQIREHIAAAKESTDG